MGSDLKTGRKEKEEKNHKHRDHGLRHPSFRLQGSPTPVFQEAHSTEVVTRVYYLDCLKIKHLAVLNIFFQHG